MDIHRRKFIKKAGLSGAGLLSFPPLVSINPVSAFESFKFSTEPTDVQKTWMDLGFGMFIHFGINTYYDREWSDGTLDPYRVNPVGLDTDRWCRIAKTAGMRYIVIVAKHHDGFCLWPSRYTDYTISRSQYNRDVLAAISNSADKYGLKLGFYYSLWDQRESIRNRSEWELIEYITNQLEELLTHYGSLVEIWFDGFWNKQQSGWEKMPEENQDDEITDKDKILRQQNFIDAWRMEGAYRWQMDHIYNYIKSRQPECIVLNNSTGSYPGVPLFPVDVRTGERHTEIHNDRKIWNWLGKNTFIPLEVELTISTKGNQRFPSGNWFWHDWDHSVRSKEEIEGLLKTVRENKTNLLLNVGPDPNGRIRKEDEEVLTSLNG
jgi:alpha-L-fucosidase